MRARTQREHQCELEGKQRRTPAQRWTRMRECKGAGVQDRTGTREAGRLRLAHPHQYEYEYEHRRRRRDGNWGQCTTARTGTGPGGEGAVRTRTRTKPKKRTRTRTRTRGGTETRSGKQTRRGKEGNKREEEDKEAGNYLPRRRQRADSDSGPGAGRCGGYGDNGVLWRGQRCEHDTRTEQHIKRDEAGYETRTDEHENKDTPRRRANERRRERNKTRTRRNEGTDEDGASPRATPPFSPLTFHFPLANTVQSGLETPAGGGNK